MRRSRKPLRGLRPFGGSNPPLSARYEEARLERVFSYLAERDLGFEPKKPEFTPSSSYVQQLGRIIQPDQKEAGLNRAQRAHETGLQAGTPEGQAAEPRSNPPPSHPHDATRSAPPEMHQNPTRRQAPDRGEDRSLKASPRVELKRSIPVRSGLEAGIPADYRAPTLISPGKSRWPGSRPRRRDCERLVTRRHELARKGGCALLIHPTDRWPRTHRERRQAGPRIKSGAA